MSSGIYTVSFGATVTAAGGDTDLFELVAGDDAPIRVRGLLLSQTSEVGDAAEEILRMTWVYLPATVTSSNGTATTARAVDQRLASPTFTAETNGTTVATTSGTALILEDFAWNIRMSPLERWWPEDCAFVARQGATLTLRQQTTLADDASFSCTVFVEEF